MKPIFVRMLMYIAPLTMMQNSEAQTNANLFLTPGSMAAAGVNFATTEADLKALAGLIEISDKLFTRFTTTYKNPTGIRYYQSGKFITISFRADSATNRSLYTQKGRFLYNIRYYDHSKLSEEIKDLVLDAFPRYTICNGVAEVNSLGRTAYIIIIEGKTTWKKVKVLANEVTIEEDYEKMPGQTLQD